MKLLDHPGITEITSKTQTKNGTRCFALETNKGAIHYAVYASGAVRALSSPGHRLTSCYKINKRTPSNHKSFIITFDENGKEIHRWHRNTYKVFNHIHIDLEEDRMQFLADFIERNYKLSYTRK